MSKAKRITIYRCEFDFARYGPEMPCCVRSTEGIDEFKDGFWLNLDLQFTKGADARYWVPPHKIRYIAKNFITSEA